MNFTIERALVAETNGRKTPQTAARLGAVYVDVFIHAATYLSMSSTVIPQYRSLAKY
jgi:hypothetical protein